MRIGVLGTGKFGSNLGLAIDASGHSAVFGARNPESRSVQALIERAPSAEIVGLAEAVARSEIVIVATAPDSLGDIAAVGGFEDKIVIDASNALRWQGGRPRLAVDRAQAEVLAELLPEARVVKAFNTLRAEHALDPRFAQGPPVTFVCGDDDAARAAVMGLAEDLGLEPVDAGPLVNAFSLEHLAALWIGIASRDGYGRTTALSLTHRGPAASPSGLRGAPDSVPSSQPRTELEGDP